MATKLEKPLRREFPVNEELYTLTISPEGRVDTLIADPRLVWADAMWIDGDGYLWIPAAQLNRTPELAGGKQSVDYPVWIYKLQIAGM